MVLFLYNRQVEGCCVAWWLFLSVVGRWVGGSGCQGFVVVVLFSACRFCRLLGWRFGVYCRVLFSVSRFMAFPAACLTAKLLWFKAFCANVLNVSNSLFSSVMPFINSRESV